MASSTRAPVSVPRAPLLLQPTAARCAAPRRSPGSGHAIAANGIVDASAGVCAARAAAVAADCRPLRRPSPLRLVGHDAVRQPSLLTIRVATDDVR